MSVADRMKTQELEQRIAEQERRLSIIEDAYAVLMANTRSEPVVERKYDKELAPKEKRKGG